MDIGTVATEAGKLVLGKAAASAGGKFVDKAWDNASKWLKQTFKGHSGDVQKKALENSESFMQNAGKQLQIIVQNSQSSPVTIQLINDNFRDPDFSATLKEATIASARTDSEEKHVLLARLIAERVTAKSEDMISLVSSTAVDAIRKLAAKHLHFLGLAALIYEIRPTNIASSLSPEKAELYAQNWWNREFSAMLPQIKELGRVDIQHMISLSCIDYNEILGRDLTSILKAGFGEWSAQKYLEESENGKKIADIFKSTLTHASLTSTGMIIGTLVHDQLTAQHTEIHW